MGTIRYNTFYTPVGLLNIAHLGHGSVHVDWEGMHIYIDPYNDAYDFTGMKKADLILLTHAHTAEMARELSSETKTALVLSETVSARSVWLTADSNSEDVIRFSPRLRDEARF